MKSLRTTFAGIELRNPIVVGSCEITSTAAGCRKAESAGVGAVVLKSLFEEDIVRRTSSDDSTEHHGESTHYLEAYHSSGAIGAYTNIIKESKASCSIPIIASLNCYNLECWSEYAKAIADAGADAIELNVMRFSYSAQDGDFEMESHILEIIKSVTSIVNIPIIVKLPPSLTNPVALINKLYSYGVKGVAMFNSPYPITIDISKMEYTRCNRPSPRSCSESLRWIALSSSAVPNIDYALSAGVMSADDVVSSILVGASAVEVVGALYTEGIEWIGKSLEEIEAWMDKSGFDSIDEFKGRLNASYEHHREHILRWQYLTT